MAKKSGKVRNAIWIFLSIALLTGAILGGLYIESNTQIEAVKFEGNYYTDVESLENALKSPVGMYADSISFDSLFMDLKTLPYVKDATVSMGIRGTLTFRIYEREPFALLVDGNRRVYLTEGGLKLPIIPEKVKDVPLVYGFSARSLSDTLKSESYRQVEDFMIAAKENELGWITISEVSWNESEGVVALTYENGVKLLFGRNEFPEKIKNWEAFYTDVVSQKGMGAFTSIDLRFKDQIVTRNS
ncbi:cell division protein FtsQ/DivIB [Rhodohalobacter sp. 614A]|uniref:cell division protein FtsQ/DivIB n=1 Tax=Rhodohalobacter sp. 614A TaxID=2908649 RepID=UPI001F2016FE|nr:cell division protein FtsQ/DivIB [Rhodohalobacter sp. 614A]